MSVYIIRQASNFVLAIRVNLSIVRKCRLSGDCSLADRADNLLLKPQLEMSHIKNININYWLR